MKTMLAGMTWLHEPEWGYDGNRLWVQTRKDTDYWQRTHYGFRRDNAHALVQEMAGNFRLTARFQFAPNAQYDQCGLVLRADENCWFKCSVEFENSTESRLGSVVTNNGYSDWATQDIPSTIQEMSYDILVEGLDIVVQYSYDATAYHQMRIAHLAHHNNALLAGIYGCSPTGPGFRFALLALHIERV